jgi:phosphoadenosine phosphosulfate reductase
VSEIDRFLKEAAGLSGPALIRWAFSTFGADGVSFASSLGAEDQIITHMIAENAPELPVFTLDTGRLYQETYDLIEKTRERYHLDISVFFPDSGRVEEMVRSKGPNLFYESIENRKLCCHIRKVEPLGRALSGQKAWIVGLRQEQSVTRQDLSPIEWDDNNGLIRIAPLATWSNDEVWEYIRKHDVPYHSLHEQGFPSIGCAPCTRAISAGEDVRAGRWWWEHPDHKECGLHAGDGTPAVSARTPGSDGDSTAHESQPAPFGIGRIRTD